MKTLLSCVLSIFMALSLFNSVSLSAQEIEPALKSLMIIDAKPLKRQSPKYPKNAIIDGQEGWVIINFIVNKKGEVVSPEISDSSGFVAFENAALRAVKRWKYTPATQNGEPVEQSKINVRLDFNFSRSVNVTEDFYMTYRELISAIKENDLTEAKELLKEIENGQIWNHTESSFYWLADAIYAKAVGDVHRELNGVNRALATNNEKLKNDNLLYLRNRQFVLNVSSGYFREAMVAYRKLQKLPDSKAMIENFKPYYEQIKEGVKGKDPIVREALISKSSRLWHRLSRNVFSLSLLEGKIEEIEIRCDAKYNRYTFAKETEWEIPKSWGKCFLLVRGDPNSKIDIIETGEYVVSPSRKKKASENNK